MSEHPKNLSIQDFTYILPEERIAKHPLETRTLSKLLICKQGNISEKSFSDLDSEIPEKSLIVFNATRVIRARIHMQRESGASIEIFCTDASENSIDFVTILQTKKSVTVRAFVGHAKRWKENEKLITNLKLENLNIQLVAERVGMTADQSIVKFSWAPENYSFAEILDAVGKIPLPPYLNREEVLSDAERYQTIYAKQNGSVAAPTAGLHFTADVLEKLKKKNCELSYLTLHVGAGTFKPVKADKMETHEMHREQIFVSKKILEQILAHQNSIIAVGTTSLRTLESIYWFGKKLILQPGKHFDSIFVSQWEPYENETAVPVPVALRAVLDWMQENKHEELIGYTQILIAPGYDFKIANGLITNFHQPQSTLLLLVSAFIGEDCKRVYEYALQNNFRFLSYGDSSLLWRK